MSSPKNSAEAVERALGEPAFAELTENAWKIRTNLIFSSIVSIAVVYGDLHIDSDSQIFGLKFKGLNDTILTNGLIAVVVYLFVHFLWVSFDALLEWRLRVTGTRVAFVTTARLGSEHGDYPGNPRQSTLYHWWKNEARKIGDLNSRMVAIEVRLLKWEEDLKARFTADADAMNIVNATVSIAGIREEIMRFSTEIKAASAAIEAARIPVSLARFNAWFSLFLRSQNLRWLVIDFLAPVLVGGYALLLLASR